MSAALYLPRASLSERIARGAIRLALGTVAGVAVLSCLGAFGAALPLLISLVLGRI